jgi:hypothetical protein
MDAAVRMVCCGGYELDGVFGGDGDVGEMVTASSSHLLLQKRRSGTSE